MNTNNLGILYIVATPIGNLKDIGMRAIDVLGKVDSIAAEDTRHSLSLLNHIGVSKPIIALHEHNERERANSLLERLQQGQSIALISDAGTPLISDPGYFLVKEARALGIKVVPIPGACAAITALSASGLPTDRFIFEGFLPAKNKARLDRLNELLHEPRTMVFYEAPHRILDTLKALLEVFGPEREVVLARELTKAFETIRAGKLAEINAWVESDANQQRGEMVLVLAGSNEPVQSEHSSQHILEILLQDLPLKQAVDLCVKITGEKKNIIYDLALKLKK